MSRARVAIIGASGIGRHHGNWWTLEGAELCAFSGTSGASVARTREALEALFGFQGTGYLDARAMLEAERPDIVDVCSPPEFHAEHIRAALDAGCDVLCEKPLLYDPAMTPETMLDAARALTQMARDKGRRLELCAQYAVGARLFAELYAAHGKSAPITRFTGRLEAPARGRGPNPVRVWVDLSPHLISVALAAFPGAAVDWQSLRTRFGGYEAEAAFDLLLPGGKPVACALFTRNRTEDPPNIRHFAFNDFSVDVESFADTEGAFAARLVTPRETRESPDMMRLLIRDYLRGKTTVDGEAAVTNLEIMLRILAAARQ